MEVGRGPAAVKGDEIHKKSLPGAFDKGAGWEGVESRMSLSQKTCLLHTEKL